MIGLEAEEIERFLEEYLEENDSHGLSVAYEEDLLEVSLTYHKEEKPPLTSALDKLLEDQKAELTVDNRPSPLYDSWREEVYSIRLRD